MEPVKNYTHAHDVTNTVNCICWKNEEFQRVFLKVLEWQHILSIYKQNKSETRLSESCDVVRSGSVELAPSLAFESFLYHHLPTVFSISLKVCLLTE